MSWITMQKIVLFFAAVFVGCTLILYIQHELLHAKIGLANKSNGTRLIGTFFKVPKTIGINKKLNLMESVPKQTNKSLESIHSEKRHKNENNHTLDSFHKDISKKKTVHRSHGHNKTSTENNIPKSSGNINETRGRLICHGHPTDSEIIYWKTVEGDEMYESPITPHHPDHHDKYLTFEFDRGGWNNVRMAMECTIVIAHAMGRTLVIPPPQHLYLLHKTHKDKHDERPNNQMGFEDFYDLDILRSHQGLHVLDMKDFLQKEGVTGGLHGKLPPQNSTTAWGDPLWLYLFKVSDAQPAWTGKYLAMPDNSHDFSMNTTIRSNPTILDRMQYFGGHRTQVTYDESLQRSHHIHFPGTSSYRLLQHFYAFAFFADSKMQSFYKRFIRDYMRYKDEIQCAGAELVAAVRKDALNHTKAISRKNGKSHIGIYYALHIRRGDLQYKEVKIGASQILENLNFKNGTPIIPSGSLVYISTDDPKGLCNGCTTEKGESCKNHPGTKGCPLDTSWKAFIEFGWELRFLDNYLKAGHLKDVNPNVYGMVESIVCSRAKVFAGTYFSTFTGYIHRLRGYHGLGEDTYYHHKNYVFELQKPRPPRPYGWWREWRAGWTEEDGRLI